jgi:exosortase A
VSAVPIELPGTRPWRMALPAVLVLVAAILLLYRDTALAMVEIWSRSDTFAHAFLVPPISLWLIWRQRERLKGLTPRPMPWLLLPLAAVAAVWLLADLMLVNAAAQFALVAMLVLAVPAVLGRQVAQAILFPLLFLFFSVPFGEFMLPAMMEWTADFVVFALQVSGIPVYREGLQFVIPSGNWSVVEACSGVRYLIASFMVGTLFAYLNYRSTRRRVIFMAASIAVPIVANWLRAYMIVMLGHLSGNTIAVGVDHLVYGWVFFGVVIMVMFVIGARWSEPDEARATVTPLQDRQRVDGPPTPGAIAVTTLLAALITVLPHATVRGLQAAEMAANTARLELPTALSTGWVAGEPVVPAWQPAFANPSIVSQRTFSTGRGPAVGVYLGYYRSQGPQRKLVGSQNALVKSQDRDWNLLVTGRHTLVVDGADLAVRTAQVLGRPSAADARRPQLVVWQLYWIDGRWVSGDVQTKLLNAWARLRGRGDDGAVLVMHATDESSAAATAALEAFTQANIAALGGLLRQTRDSR